MAEASVWRNRIVGHGDEDPNKIAAHPKNWRAHPQMQERALVGVLTEIGVVQDVLINRRTGFLVDGHLRVALAIKTKQPAIPVTYIDLDEAEEATVLATLDPIASLAQADKSKLDALLQDVKTDNADVQALLANMAKSAGLVFAPKDPVADPGAQTDRIDELLGKRRVERGQLWIIPSATIPDQAHRLLCGDSTSAEDVRRLMDGLRAALFATDPPYAVGYTGANHRDRWSEEDSNKDWSDRYHDWDDPASGEQLYDGFVSVALAEAIREDAAWYCWHASRNQAMVERVWNAHGAFVHQQIIWAKDRPILTRSWYMWQHEPCFFGWLKGKKPRRVVNDFLTTVWQFPTTGPGRETDHPTSKPVEVFAIPMRQHTAMGEICYEPFAGSGSQFVAGEQAGRLVYGLEIEPGFVAVILERLAGMGLTPRMADGSG
jgi:DNA modification methylase